jgi:hypothetical protein
MMNKQVEKKNLILVIALIIVTLIATAGAVFWFNMYLPLILK